MLFHLSHLAKTFLITLAIGSAILSFPSLLSASEPDRDAEVQATLDEAPRPFNGSFTEVALRGGLALPSADELDAGFAAELGLRTSFPMYLADHRLAYDLALFDADGQRVQVHGLHSTFAIHPLYLALLSEGFKSHFLASLHAEVGLGLRYGRQSNGGADGLGFATSVGGGFDLPLTAPNRGRSLWINANYRRTWTTLSLEADGTADAPRLHDHRFILGIAFRTNGVLW